MQKMEQDPISYLEYSQDGQIEGEAASCVNLVTAWARLLIFEPAKAMKICDAAIPREKSTVGPFLPYFHLVRVTALSMQMRLPEMKKALDQANSVVLKSPDLYCVAALNLAYAAYHCRVQEVPKAEQLMAKTLAIMPGIGVPYAQADLLGRLGSLHIFMRKYEVAMGYYVQCFQLCNRQQYRLKSLHTCIELVAVNANLRNFARAEKLYRYGVELENILQIPALLIGLNFNMGLQSKLRGNLDNALIFYNKSLSALQESGLQIPQTEYNIYNNIANVYNQLGRHNEAYEMQQKAMKIAMETANLGMQMQLSTNMGLTLVGQKRFDEAMPFFKQAEKYYTKTKNWTLLAMVLRSQCLLFQNSKDYKRGFIVMEKLDKIQIRQIVEVKNLCSEQSGKLLDVFLLDNQKLQHKLETVQKELQRYNPSTFIGSSTAAEKIINSALLAAVYPGSGVLIQGESGTGKEIVAQMIHKHSSRSDQPYITVNCASISPNLFESEFFGHARGSFTGAHQDKQGYFQLANHGSIFLDEISEMPVEFQAKLLRAIDTKAIIPVGKSKEIKIDCKIIASSNQDLQAMIQAGKFRLDLLHRINAIEILIPPLRERQEDIPELLDYFVRHYAQETNKPIPQLTADFVARMQHYQFQGNVRELKNIVERIFILFYKPVWDVGILDNFSSFRQPQLPLDSPVAKDLKSIERQMIIDALHRCEGKQSDAAKMLHLTESTLSRKIKRYGIGKS